METETSVDESIEDKSHGYAARHHRPFFIVLTVVTVTSLIFVLSVFSVLIYFRVRHGPMMFTLEKCPGNQVWTDCGYACKVSCDQLYAVCEAECSPGCECPSDKPIWHLDHCIHNSQCPHASAGNNHTLNPTEVQLTPSDSSVLEPDSDTLLHGGESDKLNRFMNTIWRLDSNRFSAPELGYNLQGRTNISSARDVATDRFFSDIDDSVFSKKGASYTSLIDLLRLYHKELREPDLMTDTKARAISRFMDTVLIDPIMVETEMFLKQQGFASSVPFKQLLHEMWFEPYPRSPRSNISDSSGFEHVFVGEVRRRKILGLHNWVQFYLLEKHQGLDYYGYLQDLYLPHNHQLLAVNVKYIWGDHRKKQGPFLVGVSPAFDMAVYTVCFVLHPNRPCQFDVQGATVDIQTYDVKHVTGWQISTAYPVI